jgi:DNA-binding IscR family transcriptional regulator
MIVNPVTNETVDYLYEGDGIRRKAQKDHYQKYVERITYEGKFINCVDDRTVDIVQALKLPEIGLLFRLYRFMHFNKDFLVHDGKNLTVTSISKLLKINENTIRKQLNSLIEKDVLIKSKNGREINFKINRDIAFIGSFQEMKFSTKVFTVDFEEMSKGLSLADVGVFYLLLPYVNTVSYIISKNPYEQNLDEVQPMNKLTDIASEIGVSRNLLTKTFKKFKDRDLVVLIDGSKKLFVVNSELISRKVKKDVFVDILKVLKNKFGKEDDESNL